MSLVANVGESVDEILTRYGKENLAPEPMANVVKPWEEPDPNVITRRWFKKGPIVAFIMFFGGRSVLEEYVPAGRGDLSQKQIKDYIAENAAGFSWRLTAKNGDETRWLRADGNLLAWKHSAPPGLRFYVPEYQEIVKKDAEARKRRGQ
jgi:hypothetical protein